MNYTSAGAVNTLNRASLSGRVMTPIEFSHGVYNEKFYSFLLEVPRLSSSYDQIPVTVSEKLLTTPEQKKMMEVDSMITVSGQFRSYNKIVDGRSKLMLTVFATDVFYRDETINSNTIELRGFICKQPIFRTTPFNREICDVLLAVNRAYNKSDYIPCIAWGRNARFIKYMPVGEQVDLHGRIQSRVYTKKLSETQTENRVAYEVSVSRIVVGENIEAGMTVAASMSDTLSQGDEWHS